MRLTSASCSSLLLRMLLVPSPEFGQYPRLIRQSSHNTDLTVSQTRQACSQNYQQEQGSRRPAARACRCACRWCGRPTRRCCAAPPCPSAALRLLIGLQNRHFRACSLTVGPCQGFGVAVETDEKSCWEAKRTGVMRALDGRDGRSSSSRGRPELSSIGLVKPGHARSDHSEG